MDERYQHRNERNGSRSRQDEQNFRDTGRQAYGEDRSSFAEAGYWDDRGTGAEWHDERPERTARYSNSQQTPWSREPGRIGQYQGSQYGSSQYGGQGSNPDWGAGGYGGYYSRDYIGAGDSQQYGQRPGYTPGGSYGSAYSYGGNYRPGRFGSSYGNYGSGSVYGSGSRHGNIGGSQGNYSGNYGGGYGIEAGGPSQERGSWRNLNQHAGRGPKGYQRSDERLREVISERLTEAPHIDPSEITVTVKNGAVTLEGTVDERWIRHEVENLVEACGGVKDIQNHLRVASARSQTGSASQALSEESMDDSHTLSGTARSTRKN